MADQGSEDTPQTMVARLARKLEQNPDNLDGWLLLGRSYTQLQEFQLATVLSSARHDSRVAKAPKRWWVRRKPSHAATRTSLDGRAGKLVEQALAVDPNSGKALFFGAAVAMRKAELPLARERFTKLLALDPPDNIKPLLQKQIEQIDQQIAEAAPHRPARLPHGSRLRAKSAST